MVMSIALVVVKKLLMQNILLIQFTEFQCIQKMIKENLVMRGLLELVVSAEKNCQKNM